MVSVLHQLSNEMADVAGVVRQGLVQIQNGRRGAGAGSIWHPDGLIVTNAHVVGSRSLKVTLPDGREVPANVLAHDNGLDLAALGVEATGLPAIGLGESRSLKPGHLVLAMGHPWGVSGAVTAGVVIGTGASKQEMPGPNREWIVAGLRLRPGNSGGADDGRSGASRGHQHDDNRPGRRDGRARTRGQGLPARRTAQRAVRKLEAPPSLTTHMPTRY